MLRLRSTGGSTVDRPEEGLRCGQIWKDPRQGPPLFCRIPRPLDPEGPLIE